MSRATYYYHAKRQSQPDKYSEIKQQITEIYHKSKGRYGYRRITMALHSLGYGINQKTVQRLMKQLGIDCMVRMKKDGSCAKYVDKTNRHTIRTLKY